jgi:ATP-binding cassette subfamily B protein
MQPNLTVKGGNPLPFLFRKTWRYSQGRHWPIVLYWTFFILANTVTFIGGPWVISKVINIVQLEGITEANFHRLLKYLSAEIFFAILFWIFHGPARVTETANAARVKINYRQFLFEGILSLPLIWHNEHHTGYTVDRLKEGANAIYGFSSQSFVIISSIIKLLVSIAIITKFSLAAGGIVVWIIVLALIVIVCFDVYLIDRLRRISRYENEIAACISDAISNIMTIIVHRAQPLMTERVRKKMEEPYTLIRSTQAIIEFKWSLVSLSCAVMTFLVLGVYFKQNIGVKTDALFIGNIYLLLRYMKEVESIFYNAASKYGDMLGHMTKMMISDSIARDFVDKKPSPARVFIDLLKVEIQNLTFSHKNAEGKVYHLDDVTFSYHRGEAIALVGESGGGKTTLLNLMRGLYEPQNLKLRINGEKIPSGLGVLGEHVGLVPQHTEIFNDTIRFNITLGKEADDALLRKLTDIACLTRVIDALPKGLDSMIKEDGVNLSGGQQQRLVLVRGLFFGQNMPIIALDEPTASLDKTNELQIMQNIRRAFPRATILSSVHQLNLLPLFDRVFVFHEGRLVGVGTPRELRIKCPQFQELCRHAATEI